MSYQTGTATDLDDLIGQLDTFITGTPGWTQDVYNGTNRRAVYHKGGSPLTVSRFIQIQWDNASGYLGNGLVGAASDVDWASQSESEWIYSGLTSVRYCNEMTGPFPSYHFFEDDDYVHMVVEISSGVYRHFGFGQALVFGALGGGAYAFAQYWNQSSTYVDNPYSTQHSPLFDGAAVSNAVRGASIHITGLDNLYDANSIYFREGAQYSSINDGNGNKVAGMMSGGWRGGPYMHFMAAQASQLNDFKPLQPIPIFHQNKFPAPDLYALVAYIPDMRFVNLYGLTVGQSLTVGSDTWMVFPITRKGNNGLSYNLEQSYNFGVAYKKVTI